MKDSIELHRYVNVIYMSILQRVGPARAQISLDTWGFNHYNSFPYHITLTFLRVYNTMQYFMPLYMAFIEW